MATSDARRSWKLKNVPTMESESTDGKPLKRSRRYATRPTRRSSTILAERENKDLPADSEQQ